MKNLEYFVTAGCSFTACSSDPDEYTKNPSGWPHWLIQHLHPAIFNNLAIAGGSNISTANNLVYYFETKKYINPDNTLVGINLTGLDRYDLICAPDHPNVAKSFSWSQDFEFGWLLTGGFINNSPPFGNKLQKNIGFKPTVVLNSLAIVQCFTYLESRNFNYFFMLMDDNILSDSPQWLKDFLNQRKDRFIKFGKFQSMKSFAENRSLLDSDGFHPNGEANQLIAREIYEQFLS